MRMPRDNMPTRSQRGVSTVAVHAVLTLLALVFAYLTWTRDKTQVASESVVALDAAKRDVNSITYQDESQNRTVTVERRLSDKGEAYAWVTVTTKTRNLATTPAMQPPHGGAPPPAPPFAAPPPATPPAAVPVKPADKVPVKPADKAPVKPADKVPAKPADKAAQKGGDKAAADKQGEKTPPPAPTVSAPPPAPAAINPHAAPPAPAAPAPGAPAPVAAPPPIHEIKEVTTVKSFRGSEQADKLLESFAPLQALRALGQVDEAKAKELGLTESKKTLTVVVKDQPRKLTIGNTSYGAGDLYARDDRGQVFLLGARYTSDFEYAESRLMERRLHRFERADLSSVEITVGAKKRVLVQQKKQDPVNYFWADDKTPDKKDDSLRNWMDKVLRIAISDYVAKGEEPQPVGMSQAPGAGAPQSGEVMVMRFFDGKKEIGSAHISRYPKGPQTEYYAVTEITIGLVRLLAATAESAVQDAEKW